MDCCEFDEFNLFQLLIYEPYSKLPIGEKLTSCQHYEHMASCPSCNERFGNTFEIMLVDSNDEEVKYCIGNLNLLDTDCFRRGNVRVTSFL